MVYLIKQFRGDPFSPGSCAYYLSSLLSQSETLSWATNCVQNYAILKLDCGLFSAVTFCI
jgi:hypothetical protein